MNGELEPINNEENGIAKLALLLQISLESAREYYAAVHKYFMNPKPSAFFIAEVIEKDSLVNPKPNLVAKNIAKRLREYYQKTGQKKSSQMVYVEKRREEISPKSKELIPISKKVRKIKTPISPNDHHYELHIQNDKLDRKDKNGEVKATGNNPQPADKDMTDRVKNMYVVEKRDNDISLINITEIDEEDEVDELFNEIYENYNKFGGIRKLNYGSSSRSEPKCPHGVPVNRICPICNPKEYKFWAGDD